MSFETPVPAPRQEYVPPRIRYAPCSELRIYQIQESELDELARGSAAAVELNLAIFFLSGALTLTLTLITVTISSIHLFTVFVVVAVGTAIAGVILGVLWARTYKSSRKLADEIKARMPPEAGIQEPLTTTETASIDVCATGPEELPPA